MTDLEPGDPVLVLIDTLIADLAIGASRHVSHRAEDDDVDTFVLQHDEAGRLRLPRPDLDVPETVLVTAQAAQSYLCTELAEPIPRCPLHPDHALDLVADDAGYDWVCPAHQWRCQLGDYAEQAWPHFPEGRLAPLLGHRMKRRGITGVRTWGVADADSGPVASFAVADVTRELVAALTDAASPLQVEVHEHPRRPRRKIAPVTDATPPGPAPPLSHRAPAIRIVLAASSVPRGGRLGYTVVNDGVEPIMTGYSYQLDQRDDGWWWEIDVEAIWRAIGLGVAPGGRRELGATIPARAVPGIYRLRKTVRFTPHHRRPPSPGRPPSGLDPIELTATFRVTAEVASRDSP